MRLRVISIGRACVAGLVGVLHEVPGVIEKELGPSAIFSESKAVPHSPEKIGPGYAGVESEEVQVVRSKLRGKEAGDALDPGYWSSETAVGSSLSLKPWRRVRGRCPRRVLRGGRFIKFIAEGSCLSEHRVQKVVFLGHFWEGGAHRPQEGDVAKDALRTETVRWRLLELAQRRGGHRRGHARRRSSG